MRAGSFWGKLGVWLLPRPWLDAAVWISVCAEAMIQRLLRATAEPVGAVLRTLASIRQAGVLLLL